MKSHTADITDICRRFGRKTWHFTDNLWKDGKHFREFVTVTKGYKAHTEIKDNDEVLCEFLLWLDPRTRAMLPIAGLEKTLEFAKNYKPEK